MILLFLIIFFLSILLVILGKSTTRIYRGKKDVGDEFTLDTFKIKSGTYVSIYISGEDLDTGEKFRVEEKWFGVVNEIDANDHQVLFLHLTREGISPLIYHISVEQINNPQYIKFTFTINPTSYIKYAIKVYFE